MNCRNCNEKLGKPFIDLGLSPPSNSLLSASELSNTQKNYPLKLAVCKKCWLVQTIDFVTADQLFTSQYPYFSSTSSSWLNHAKKYADSVSDLLSLNSNSFVIEIASNDGYLLKNFVRKKIPCLGIEPTTSTALFAESIGIPVLQAFFNQNLAKKLLKDGIQADLIIGNNVLAHVPDLNNFVSGLKISLKRKGTITLEFPHLLNLFQFSQFDTIYHEHFSYFSFFTSQKVMMNHGLRIFKVEKLQTHGGSLRIFACHDNDSRKTEKCVEDLLDEENNFGLRNLSIYNNFKANVSKVKNDLLNFLFEQKNKGKKVVAYGAAAKGNTLLNYSGITSELIECVVDASPSKWNKFLPGSKIPIFSTETLKKRKIDFLLILPWNLKNEIISENLFLARTGTKFCVAIPNFTFCKI